MSEYKELNFSFQSIEETVAILGHQDRHLRLMEDYFHVDIITRGERVFVRPATEETIAAITALLQTLQIILKYEKNINERDILYSFKMLEHGKLDELISLHQYKMVIGKDIHGQLITAKTLNQRHYIHAIDAYDLVFGVGPAGTGKTFLAVVKGVSLLKNQQVKRIILTRPAVEAGENLGFLPGDLKEKVDPYLRPLYDALHITLGYETTERLIEKGVIEIAPLAYMRGRTLDDAFVILDEAQNTTEQQMKMFLTRLGFQSKMVVTGDISQIDLPRGHQSGLITAIRILQDMKDVKICYFDLLDVIRHPLVQKVLERYEAYEAERTHG